MTRLLLAFGIAIFAVFAGVTLAKATLVPLVAIEDVSSAPYWKQYTNGTYNFSLNFTDPWRGVRVIDKREVLRDNNIQVRRYYFALPTGDYAYPTGFAHPMVINIYTTKNWRELENKGEYLPKKLGADEHYVYAYEPWFEPAQDLESKGVDPAVVADSFRLVY